MQRENMEHVNQITHVDKRIVFLDYLRIFAFISVLVGHKFSDYWASFSNNFDIHATPRLIVKLLLPLIQAGGTGVVVFFLISGYIITHVLQTEKTAEFLIKRIFRIYPLYIVAVLIQYIPVFAIGKTPDFLHLLAQLSLMGDFFGTSYTLNGVEWTLRAEVLFYLYMAFLKGGGVLHKNARFLPYIYILTVFLCAFLCPIPSEDIWSKGYLTIYGPFLLLGSSIYLVEKRLISITMFSICMFLIFYNYYHFISVYQKLWLNAHFAMLGFLIFIAAFLFRRIFLLTRWAAVLSDMTYAVYLFHNWFFEYIKDGLVKLNYETKYSNQIALCLLFITCYILVRLVEKPGIKFGKLLLRKINRNV